MRDPSQDHLDIDATHGDTDTHSVEDHLREDRQEEDPSVEDHLREDRQEEDHPREDPHNQLPYHTHS
jgi:hypothetical protein